MAISKYTLVTYGGVDVGRIYLEDIGKRSQLGGGEQFVIGQDTYISHGETIGLVNTNAVLTSAEFGTLKKFSTPSTSLAKLVIGLGGTAFLTEEGGVTGLTPPFTLVGSDGITGVNKDAT